MRKIRLSHVTLIVVAALLVLLSLPIVAAAWTSCHGDPGCRTCFFYSDDGQSTYQGYMTICPYPV